MFLYFIHLLIFPDSVFPQFRQSPGRFKAAIFLFAISILFFSCNRDQAFIEKGLQKEKEGKIAEALHLYTQALKVNSSNPVANERLGFLLSESQFSIIPAMHHLESARNSDSENLKVGMKLIDLTLFVSDFSKSRRIQKELSIYLTDLENDTLASITLCLESMDEKERNKALSFLENTELSFNTKYIYRSLALCYELNNNSLKAEEIVTKYRKALSENP